MEQFPPNSRASKQPEPKPKKVERITTTEPIRHKPGLWKKFKNTFLGGDAKTAAQYVIFAVLIPSAKDALYEASSQGFEKLIYGESRRQRNAPPSGVLGHVSYNRYSGSQRRQLSPQARARHNFDEIILTNRQEATDVVDRLFDLVSHFDAVTVADLYELVGVASSHTDHKWGWTDMRGTGVVKVSDGFLISLPEPQPLSN